MNLNPAIVIPTYWCGRRTAHSVDRGVLYDHMTPIDQEGELPRCLDSLRQVVGIGRIFLLVVSEPGVENQASEKVHDIARRFPGLDIVVIGDAELRYIHRQMAQFGFEDFTSAACLTGYGAVRNLGVLVSSIFGYDTVVFIDDDEIVLGPDFLERAVYGIAMKTPSGKLITGKTGYFFNDEGKYTAPVDTPWYDHFWNRSRGFNEYIERAVSGPRLSRAQVACGGCLVLHADLYGRVAFDPWISRGEDLDYLLSAHMYGVDIWFDNTLNLRHLAPPTLSNASRWTQDMYRWFYEARKIEFARTQIDLMQVKPESYEHYPGTWLGHSIRRRAIFTAFLRGVGCPEHGQWFKLIGSERKQASEYARENCAKYFELQHQWPDIVRALWRCTPLVSQIRSIKTMASTSAFTGRFAAITVDDR